ncbi:hypothetical protein [Helicobacter sp.]|uniref:hypothetical protein n=1 Tax=Helicobacter sp. TaxID=218 RepID=UPI0025C30BEB|nr:hypothetical protein [Helicobacter sp.]MCI5967923.1 hypothetical protein [Helicobacter sp.]MDY2585285.1 hypothetical protein [Helicobacter sp.]
MNISLAASKFGERAVILDYLFKHKTPRAFIYSIDDIHAENPNVAHYDFLYNANRMDDIRVYFSFRFASCLIKNAPKCGQKVELEDLLKWNFKERRVLQNFGGFENFPKGEMRALLKAIASKETGQIEILDFQNGFNASILPFIKAHPNTQFYFIIPPYSTASYKIDKGKFERLALRLKWLLQQTKDYQNVSVYGFDNLSYTDNIANYRDFVHYNSDMNSWHLDAIKGGEHILTLENVNAYLKTMGQKIQAYDIAPLVDIAKNTLKE